MPKYEIRVGRTETRYYITHIESDDELIAKVKALGEAYNIDFHNLQACRPDYFIDYIEEIDD